MNNRLEHNLVGLVVAAGFDAKTPVSGQANTFRVTSQRDRVLDNVGQFFAGFGGGVVAFAAMRDGTLAPASNNNVLQLKLLQTEFSGNLQGTTPRHLTVIASRSNVDTLTGANNRIDLLVRSVESDGATGSFVLDDSSPDSLNATNTVNIIGSDIAFERANTGLTLP